VNETKELGMFKTNVKDLIVFVTGANKKSGIGRSLAEEALERGAKKVYATARNLAELEGLVKNFPERIVPLELDVTQAGNVEKIAHIAQDTHVLINNAGACGVSGCLDHYDEGMARREMDVNYFGPLRLIHAFSKNLIEKEGSAIVNIISIGGLYPSPVHVTYSASKAALYSLTQALRIEIRIKGLTLPVFGVYPGPIDTNMSQNLDVQKGSPQSVAKRVFEGMTQGILDITTDELSDYFQTFLTKDPGPIEALKKAFLK
jgi:short-subunit dehydrogenase